MSTSNESTASYDWALQAIRILDGVMTVVPRTSILHCPPGVDKLVFRSNGTLSDTIDTIHLHGLPLSNPMPVDACAIICKIVLDSNVDTLKDASTSVDFPKAALRVRHLHHPSMLESMAGPVITYNQHMSPNVVIQIGGCLETGLYAENLPQDIGR